EPDIAEESLRPPPPDVRVGFITTPRTREHAVELVERGEIDAALEPYALHATQNMRYLMTDYRRAEQEFFRRTGAYTRQSPFRFARRDREQPARNSRKTIRRPHGSQFSVRTLSRRKPAPRSGLGTRGHGRRFLL